jgi:hypothetical protein
MKEERTTNVHVHMYLAKLQLLNARFDLLETLDRNLSDGEP